MEEKPFSGDAAKWLIEQAVERGASAQRLLCEAGLPESWLVDERAVLSGEQYRLLVRCAIREANDRTLALGATRQAGYVGRFGFWGYAILSSANWRQASELAMRYWDVAGSLMRLVFREQGSRCSWEALPRLDLVDRELLVFAVEKVISASLATIDFATGSPAPGLQVEVSYAAPQHADLYREYWSCPVEFGADRNVVTMDASVLDRPLLTANPEIVEVCQAQCAELLARLRGSDDLVERIRLSIVGSPGRFPSATEMAHRLAMSARTLRRRLAERQTTYRQVLDEVRCELAIGYLTSTDLTIDEISGLLGYAEPTAFRRSFRRWTNRSASSYRRARADG